MEDNNFQNEESMYSNLINNGVSNCDVYGTLGAIYLSQGKYDECIELLIMALRIKSNSPNVYNNLAIAFRKTGSYDNAKLSYRHCLKFNPQYSDGYNNLANMLLDNGNINSAIRSYQLSANYNFNNPNTHTYLGIAFRENVLREAISTYKTSLELNSHSRNIHEFSKCLF